MHRLLTGFVVSVSLVLGGSALAQQGPPPPYGAPVTLEQAKKMAAAAEAEAKKNNWNMTIVVTDPSGSLIYLERMDNAFYGSINVAISKAKSATLFKRPTNVFNEFLAKGNTYLLSLEGASMVPGGFPIISDGKIIGGMGASGGTGEQDSQVVEAGLKALQ